MRELYSGSHRRQPKSTLFSSMRARYVLGNPSKLDGPSIQYNTILIHQNLLYLQRSILSSFAGPSFLRIAAVLKSLYDAQPATTIVPNRLSSIRDLLHEQLREWLPKFCAAVTRSDDHSSGWSWFAVNVSWMCISIELPSKCCNDRPVFWPHPVLDPLFCLN